MKILLVDDDFSSVVALTNLLEREHSLVIASNGADALEMFNADDFDLVVTDIKMPKMNGIELLKAIRCTGKKSHVIIVTGFPQHEHLKDAEYYQTYAVFSKPINVNNFMEAIKDIASRKAIGGGKMSGGDGWNGHEAQTGN